ncbi:hypothetical protein TorRG33x02_207650 [Trema orientale]|uniref:Uncharacterized protein n=1 Tax=Trema orientale TaxID=63057 RepID=A0A2P5ED85_TREOI|nr:hypothetical protein TorRG33x02_207650 [Trema orientale]
MEDNRAPRSTKILLASSVRSLLDPNSLAICLAAAINFSSPSNSGNTDLKSAIAIEESKPKGVTKKDQKQKLFSQKKATPPKPFTTELDRLRWLNQKHLNPETW